MVCELEERSIRETSQLTGWSDFKRCRAEPSGLYEVAAWLLAPAPDDFSTPAQDDSVDLEEPEDPSTS